MTDKFDPYVVLGVANDATLEQIRAAYRKLSKTAHPDGGGDNERFNNLRRAFSVLSDSGRRANYDDTGNVEDATDTTISAALQLFDQFMHKLIANYLQNFDPTFDPRRCDVIAAFRDHLNVEISSMSAQMIIANKAIDFMVDMEARFTTDGENLLARVLANRVSEMKGRRDTVKQAIGQRMTALAFVSKYKFRSDDVKQVLSDMITVHLYNG